MDDADERELIERAGRGDKEASSELIRRYRERIYRAIFRFTRNPDDADDLFQETFFRVFRSLRSFGRRSGFYTWVYRIAVNQCLNFLKKKGREMPSAKYFQALESGGQSPLGASEATAATELRDRLAAAIESLPLSYRACVNLVVFEAMSHHQAARVLGCSEKTVSWRMHKARKMLQNSLRHHLGEKSDEL